MNITDDQYLNQWIAKANEDLLVVDKLTEFEIIAKASVCFHCQQSVEKFLKAFLIFNGKEIKKTHSIEYLLVECGDIDPDFMDIEPKELSDFGVEARSPGDRYIPSDKETLEYKDLAHLVKKMVERKIKFSNPQC